MAGASTYSRICYEVFSGHPPHEDASTLLQLVALAASRQIVRHEEIRSSAWLASVLQEVGFVEDEEGLRAPEGLCERLTTEQNQARARVHAEAAEQREELLASLLGQAAREGAREKVDIGSGRDALRAFASEWCNAVSVGPLLLGIAALLRAQASHSQTRQVWVASRASVLNGGDSFCKPAVDAMRAVGFIPVEDALADCIEEGRRPEEMAWTVRSGIWTAHEMRALAGLAERLARKAPLAGRATGVVKPTTGDCASRSLKTWHEWLSSLIGSLRCMI
ncbi:hypothetical protein AB1Y20_015072 [Prymnesium parvum]|uniref:Uncharacterized protein n=1 Tax=Prymnesium parvum TaxID=97485 RepID=A0AB34JZL6_PRYPA|mmetsp:Transcript_33342/g.83042  ORF Transcript_33342/g.83042 Transcript_33342/m.83042 type:complete len:278 (+) Transcript_33342:102-935(+)